MARGVTPDGLLCQIRLNRKLEPFAGILRLSPKYVPLDPDTGTQRRIEAMILALTPEERRSPGIVTENGRILEISCESGESENDVRKFLRQLDAINDLRRA